MLLCGLDVRGGAVHVFDWIAMIPFVEMFVMLVVSVVSKMLVIALGICDRFDGFGGHSIVSFHIDVVFEVSEAVGFPFSLNWTESF